MNRKTIRNLKPFFIGIIIYGISYHVIYITSEKFWSDPNKYCKTNAKPSEYDICTKSVAIGGFMVIIIPMGIGLGTYAIASKIQERRRKK